MIDTPQSIASNRNTTATQRYIFAPAKPLILPSGAIAWSNWQQQTENAETLPTDNYTLSEVTDVYGACRTSAAYIGNVSED